MWTLHRVIEPRATVLPPRTITLRMLRRADIKPRGESSKRAATVLGHFAYGGATDAIYSFLRALSPRPLSKLQSASAGMAFGVAVWLTSYLGWLPAAHLLTPATQHPARRNVLMILAHVLWGACLGMMLEKDVKRED